MQPHLSVLAMGLVVLNACKSCSASPSDGEHHMIRSGPNRHWCIQVRDGVGHLGNKLILNRCQENDDGQRFKLDRISADADSFFIRPKVNTDLCVSVRETEDHSWLRLEHCSVAIHDIWTFRDTGGATIHPWGDENLCVTNLGVRADQDDPIMLKTIEVAAEYDEVFIWNLDDGSFDHTA
eukprot:CAMPEP_0183312316 /NCGR_PEP_ID=MMETSP0160_2-20130417/41221_1 /TAXON_ID=2839 ORGANISM="Odontella Sinensis, Strain Grunow 1884" /NCGR_SAMPLE_ID=MMETSP0160_2 /ASSEMBLY_ACC=CAM_ASM_000250 /LENGTH=179 /DNA_ID=CAMNT_0025477149 /DNA_START=149 /DNA_END=688 /DNA_ORIENTATION=+